MEALIAAIVFGLFISGLCGVVLYFRFRFAAELRRKSRKEIEDLVFHYDNDYFDFIGHQHPDVVLFKQLLQNKDIKELKRNWRNLSASFVDLEAKAGHKGRPLIMDYYNWYEVCIKELERRGR